MSPGKQGKGVGSDRLLRDARALEGKGDIAGAIKKYLSFIAKHPDDPKARRARAVCATRMMGANMLTQARALVEDAPDHELDDPDVCQVVAQVYAYNGMLDEALGAARRAAARDPDRADVVATLVTVLVYKGDHGGAVGALDDAWARGLDSERLDNALAGIAPRVGRIDEAIDRLSARLKGGLGGGVGDARMRAELGFHLADLYGTRGDDREAWDAATAANRDAERVRLQSAGPGGPSLERLLDVFTARLRATIETIDGAALSGLKPDEKGPEDRGGLVFVCGMPRSGTTLVEQIVSAHPDAGSAGESNAVEHARRDLWFVPEHMGQILERTPGKKWSKVGAGIEREIRSRGGDGSVMVDKQPGNDEHIGLLAACAPGARVIITRRDPRDVAVSCYFRNFTMGHEWAADMGAILAVQRAKLEMHEHWLRVIPEHAPWLDVSSVDYASLVSDPEVQSRALIERCGLVWDDACLRFSERERLVPTLMPHQAGRGVYTSSVARWERYVGFMDPAHARELEDQVGRFGFGG